MPRTRTRKRKFQGNQHSSPTCAKLSKNNSQSSETESTSEGNVFPAQDKIPENVPITPQSASARKIGTNNGSPTPDVNENQVSGFCLMDMAILHNIFKMLPCKNCLEFELTLVNDITQRMGCASCYSLQCNNCRWTETFYTSGQVGHFFEVNRRIVYAMRSIGCGLTAIKRFCTTMNMPPPLGTKPFARHTKAILRAVKDVAESSINDAAKEIHNSKSQDDDEIVKTAISCDGTWQRRGFSSLHGCVTAISMETGKILDIEPLSKVCHPCKKHEGKEDTVESRLWKAEHAPKCKSNYSGSAPAMEPEGAKRIFNRSVINHNLQYDEFYGDGDSKSFSAVENIYKEEYDVIVEKKECVGHVQKRLGTALRKLKKEKKGLGGKGKLTDNMIDKLQNYYGIAIRSNSGNLAEMKQNVLATLFHCASTDKRSLHTYCPKGESSWCRYQKDCANKTSTYKHGKGLPLEVIAELKPVYARLSDDDLLRKCLNGKTQNQNESFNGMIWNRIPKTVFVGTDSFQLGVYDAVAHFNIGTKATVKVLQTLGISPGTFCVAGLQQADNLRVQKSNYKVDDKNKTRRKVLRGKRKGQADKNQHKEGETYSKGAF